MQNIKAMLEGIGAQQVGIGGMQGMAVDGMQFLQLLGQLQEQVATLSAENADLRTALDQQGYTEPVKLTPQFPNEFYIYGDGPLSYSPSDEEIQEAIDSLVEFDLELEGTSFIELTKGSALVIKTSNGETTKYIVTRGYYEYVVGTDGIGL